MAGRGRYGPVSTDPEEPTAPTTGPAAGGSIAGWVIVIILVALVAAAGVVVGSIALSDYSSTYPHACTDMNINSEIIKPSENIEIFVFSNSLDDFGNWLKDIVPLGYYYLDADRIVQPSTSNYNVFPAGPGKHSVNHVATSGRWGDSVNAMDFLAQYLKIKSYKSSDITSYNSNLNGHNGFMVNFAIGGATANGNVYNAPLVPLPHDFIQVEGPFGYNYQVTEFVSKFVVNSAYKVKNTTWFFYNWMGANDYPLILDCANVTACSITFIETHLANIQTLYNAGMRKLVLTITDGGYNYNPETLKVDPTGFTAAFLDGFAAFTYSSSGEFLDQFMTQMYTLMPDLQVYRILATTTINDVVADLNDYGIRTTFPKDPDPRNPYLNLTSAFPFPTLIDYQNTYGAVLTKTFYYDDNHPTQAGYKAIASRFIKAMSSEYKVCNVASLGQMT